MAESQGVSFSVDADHDAFSPWLRQQLRAMRDVRPVLEEFAASNLAETQQRFEGEHGPDGKKWHDFAESTKEKMERAAKKAATTKKGKKRKKPYKARTAPKLLRDQGELYDSLDWTVTPFKQAMVGTNKVYGRIHQLGGPTGRGRKVMMPARPYLGISEAGWTELEAIVRDHLERASARAGT